MMMMMIGGKAAMSKLIRYEEREADASGCTFRTGREKEENKEGGKKNMRLTFHSKVMIFPTLSPLDLHLHDLNTDSSWS